MDAALGLYRLALLGVFLASHVAAIRPRFDMTEYVSPEQGVTLDLLLNGAVKACPLAYAACYPPFVASGLALRGSPVTLCYREWTDIDAVRHFFLLSESHAYDLFYRPAASLDSFLDRLRFFLVTSYAK